MAWADLVPLVGNNTILKEFEEFLQSHLPQAPSFHPTYNDALKEMLKAGGKRFRPLILLEVVKAYRPELIQNSFWVACGIEFLHTYSLIHDDLPTFDDAPLRRGHPTLHITYDEVTATLVGDALNSHSFLMIADAPLSEKVKVALIRELSLNGGTTGMVLGQAIDCYFEEKKLSLDELTYLHIHKTAKLIAASLKMGAIIAGVDKKIEEKLYEIGLDIGLLFQVQDDIIDATFTSEKAGKPTNNDNSKNSFTNLLGVDGAVKERERIKTKIESEIDSLNPTLKRSLQQIIYTYFK